MTGFGRTDLIGFMRHKIVSVNKKTQNLIKEFELSYFVLNH